VRIVPAIDSDSGSPQARPLLTECGEIRDVHLLMGMEQQMLEVDQALQAPENDPRTLEANAEKTALVEKERCLRRSA
jgi:hypothetical protein